MEKIPIVNTSKHALVDTEYYKVLSGYRWWLIGGYAATTVRCEHSKENRDGRITVFMHQMVMTLSHDNGVCLCDSSYRILGQDIDHINSIKTDNRLCNLQYVSTRYNCSKGGKRMNKTSIYHGVSRKGRKWMAQVAFKGVNKYIGLFDDDKEAAMAVNKFFIDNGIENDRIMNFREVQGVI